MRLLIYNIANDYDDESIKNVFCWASNIGGFMEFILFRNTTRNRRRNVYFSTNLNSFTSRGDSIQISSQMNNNNLLDVSIGDIDDEYELEFEEYINLESDLDRLLVESLFTMPNLWLQTELISNDYIYQLPVWQFTQVETVTNYTSNSSTDSSDNEDQYVQCTEIESTSKLDFQSTKKAILVSDCCLSFKEAPEIVETGCCSKMTESSSIQTNLSIQFRY